MLLKQLDSGLLEGIVEADDVRFDEDIFFAIAEELSKDAPEIVQGLAAQELEGLPAGASERIKTKLDEVLIAAGLKA